MFVRRCLCSACKCNCTSLPLKKTWLSGKTYVNVSALSFQTTLDEDVLHIVHTIYSLNDERVSFDELFLTATLFFMLFLSFSNGRTAISLGGRVLLNQTLLLEERKKLKNKRETRDRLRDHRVSSLIDVRSAALGGVGNHFNWLFAQMTWGKATVAPHCTPSRSGSPASAHRKMTSVTPACSRS